MVIFLLLFLRWRWVGIRSPRIVSWKLLSNWDDDLLRRSLGVPTVQLSHKHPLPGNFIRVPLHRCKPVQFTTALWWPLENGLLFRVRLCYSYDAPILQGILTGRGWRWIEASKELGYNHSELCHRHLFDWFNSTYTSLVHNNPQGKGETFLSHQSSQTYKRI